MAREFRTIATDGFLGQACDCWRCWSDRKNMNIYVGLLFLFTPVMALGSNFGDLPSVLPVFWIAIIISIFVAIAKAMKPVENSEERKFRISTYLQYQFLGVVLSFFLTVALWLSTL